jgi:hypothetical protein
MASILDVRGTIDISANSRIPAVYFLCHDDEILYVGQSVNVLARKDNWITARERGHANAVPFTQVFMLRVPEADLQRWEDYYIEKFNPPYNRAPLRKTA